MTESECSLFPPNNILKRYTAHQEAPCPMCVAPSVSVLVPSRRRTIEARGLGNPPERARGNCLLYKENFSDR